jgi:endonuclease/exonuclease/phosphatase family metal-dependent hydrolase
MPGVVVASYNVHGGVDGWGRPYDVVEACRFLDADVLVLQESWSAEGEVSLARQVAGELGYVATELAFARGWIVGPPPGKAAGWGPALWDRGGHGLRLARRRGGEQPRRRARVTTAVRERGTWGIAVLARPPVTASRTIDFGQLPTDSARRGAIEVEVAVTGDGSVVPLHVTGTHMAHLSQGSPRHLAVLRRAVRDLTPGPAVLAGDMNLWGPPLAAVFPGWSRAVRGRSWPTWSSRPLAQADHILVTSAVRVVSGEVLRIGGSDHYPVRASLEIG